MGAKRITDAQRSEVIRLLERGTARTEIVRQTGVAYSTVAYLDQRTTVTVSGRSLRLDGQQTERLATGRPDETVEEDSSLKDTILLAVARGGPFADVAGVLGAVRERWHSAVGPHEVVHLLWSLNKRGMVKFRERKGVPGGATSALVAIEATERGYQSVGLGARAVVVGPQKWSHRGEPPQHAGDRTDFRTHALRAEGGPVERSLSTAQAGLDQPESTETSASDSESVWPELDALRARRDERASASVQANAYIEAAARVESFDAEAAELLSTRATDLMKDYALSRVEAEYLRFADEMEKTR